jgi:hypothetical protein
VSVEALQRRTSPAIAQRDSTPTRTTDSVSSPNDAWLYQLLTIGAPLPKRFAWPPVVTIACGTVQRDPDFVGQRWRPPFL